VVKDVSFCLRVRLLLTGCLILFLLSGCGEPKPTAAPPVKPAVGVRPAVMKGVSQSFEFVGRIKAVNKVDVRARVEGFLEQVLFQEGQQVKAGDLLYEIEKVQFQALVDQANANVARPSSTRTKRSTTATGPRSCKCKRR